MGALHARKKQLPWSFNINLDKTPIHRCFNICEKNKDFPCCKRFVVTRGYGLFRKLPRHLPRSCRSWAARHVTRSRWCSLSCSTSMVALVFKHIDNVKLNIVVCILLEIMTFWEFWIFWDGYCFEILRERNVRICPNRAQSAACPCCFLNGSCYFSDRDPVIGFRCRGILMNSMESFS